MQLEFSSFPFGIFVPMIVPSGSSSFCCALSNPYLIVLKTILVIIIFFLDYKNESLTLTDGTSLTSVGLILIIYKIVHALYAPLPV